LSISLFRSCLHRGYVVHIISNDMSPDKEALNRPTGMVQFEPQVVVADLAKTSEIAHGRFGKLLIVAEEDLLMPNRKDRLIRILNHVEVNAVSDEFAKKTGKRLLRLTIETDGQAAIDGQPLEPGPFVTDMFNALLLGYLEPPFSLDDLHTRFGFNGIIPPVEHQLNALDRKAHELRVRGTIIYLDPINRRGITLRPLKILDRNLA
jgi:hypothetical protein